MGDAERDPAAARDAVDFTIGQPEPAPDEELPESRISRSRLLPRVLALAAAGLLAAVLVTRIHTGGDRHAAAPSQPAPSVAGPSAPASFAERPVPPDGGTGQLLADVPQHGPRWCPGGSDGSALCTASSRVPASVLAVLHEQFPASSLLSAFEEQVRDVGFGPGGLWYREVHARQGRHRIVVVVHRRSASDLAGISEDIDASGSTLTVNRIVGGFTVQVRLRGPAGSPASRRQARALFAFAGNARLRADG